MYGTSGEGFAWVSENLALQSEGGRGPETRPDSASQSSEVDETRCNGRVSMRRRHVWGPRAHLAHCFGRNHSGLRIPAGPHQQTPWLRFSPNTDLYESEPGDSAPADFQPICRAHFPDLIWAPYGAAPTQSRPSTRTQRAASASLPNQGSVRTGGPRGPPTRRGTARGGRTTRASSWRFAPILAGM